MITPGRPKPRPNALLGVLLVARGKAEGLLQFGGTREAVLAALAPLAAFLVVAAGLTVLGGSLRSFADVCAISIGLLGPLVLSFEVARRLGRAQQWPRFAAAFCWCQWAAPMVLVAVLMLMSLLIASGVSGDGAEIAGLAAMFAYGLWLHWFLARHALELPPWRAMGLVVAVNVLTTALIVLPQLADYAVNGAPPG
jgi:hypothetical protein